MAWLVGAVSVGTVALVGCVAPPPPAPPGDVAKVEALGGRPCSRTIAATLLERGVPLDSVKRIVMSARIINQPQGQQIQGWDAYAYREGGRAFIVSMWSTCVLASTYERG